MKQIMIMAVGAILASAVFVSLTSEWAYGQYGSPHSSCMITVIGDGCAAHESCYVKPGSPLQQGVCLPVQMVKSAR